MTLGKIATCLIGAGTFVGMVEGEAPLFAYLLVGGLYVGTYAFFRELSSL